MIIASSQSIVVLSAWVNKKAPGWELLFGVGISPPIHVEVSSPCCPFHDQLGKSSITPHPLLRCSEPFTGGSPELLWVCTTAVLCAGLIGATTCALAPAAEARTYEQQRRHELRQLRREIRRDTRDYRRARRAYHREVNRYPRVIPAYGVRYGNVYGAPAGFGVQLRF